MTQTHRVSLPKRPGPHRGSERRPNGRENSPQPHSQRRIRPRLTTLPWNCFQNDQGLGRERPLGLKANCRKHLKMEGKMLRRRRGLRRVSKANLQEVNHASLPLQPKEQRRRANKMHRCSSVQPCFIFTTCQRQIHSPYTSLPPEPSLRRRFSPKSHQSIW